MQSPNAIALRVGAWRVDTAAARISRDGEEVRLEPRMLRLLQCLVERAGETVTSDDLLSQVWPGVIVTPDSVYQAIATLRRLLGDDPKQPSYIATVPRVGYKLIAPVAPWTETMAQALTPNGLSAESPQPNKPPVAWRRRLGLAFAAGVATLVGLGVMGIVPLPRLEIGAPQKFIAVLPFLDLTESMGEEYFADGITEELIDRFSKIPGLRVPSPTASFYFKGKQEPVPEMAHKLGVGYVLDGSVRKSGGMVRVAARLVCGEDGIVLWSETYDRPLDDLLMVQDDIADAVSKALQPTIGDTARPAAERAAH